jgi:hypothetical protein
MRAHPPRAATRNTSPRRRAHQSAGRSAGAQCIAGRVLAVAPPGGGRSAPAALGDGRPFGGWLLIGWVSGRSRVGSGAIVIPHAYDDETPIADFAGTAQGEVIRRRPFRPARVDRRPGIFLVLGRRFIPTPPAQTGVAAIGRHRKRQATVRLCRRGSAICFSVAASWSSGRPYRTITARRMPRSTTRVWRTYPANA